MPDGIDPLSTLLLILCLLLSFFTSISEAALMSANKIRIRSLAEEGNKRARRVDQLYQNPNRWLCSLLVLNNVANIGASAITTAITMRLFGSAGVGIATGIVTLVVLIFTEMTPKSAAMRRADSVAMSIAGLVVFFNAVLYPVVAALTWLTSRLAVLMTGKETASAVTFTEEELLTMVDVSHEEGVLEVEEKDMIRNVFEFSDDEVGAVMVPRIHIITVDEDDDEETVFALIRAQRFSRMPVTNDETGEVTGILHIKDLLLDRPGASEDRPFSVKNYMRPAHFVYEFNNAAKTFHQMRENHVPMSVVLDEYGVMVGLVTMEDFIEEIVGDIDDEYDDPHTDILKESETEFVFDGSMAIDEVNEQLGLDIQTEDFESIGGYMMGEMGRLPEPGAVMDLGGTMFKVLSTTNNRIEKLRATLSGAGKIDSE